MGRFGAAFLGCRQKVNKDDRQQNSIILSKHYLHNLKPLQCDRAVTILPFRMWDAEASVGKPMMRKSLSVMLTTVVNAPNSMLVSTYFS